MKKELIDQSLHFSIGFILVVVLSFFIPVVWAAIAVMVAALIREKLQHRDKTIWQLGAGSMLDLLFWALGTGLAVGLILSDVI